MCYLPQLGKAMHFNFQLSALINH